MTERLPQRRFHVTAQRMKALRSVGTCLAVLVVSGCHHFPRVPYSKSVAGHTLRLSHTRLCVGDSDPIEVQFTPAAAHQYLLRNEEGASVATGPVSAAFELSLKALPMSRYTLVVPVSETEVVEANVEVARCVYY